MRPPKHLGVMAVYAWLRPGYEATKTPRCDGCLCLAEARI